MNNAIVSFLIGLLLVATGHSAVSAQAITFSSSDTYRFPATAFGEPEIGFQQSSKAEAFLESVYNLHAPSFEPLSRFLDTNRYRRRASAVGRLDIRVSPEGEWFPCTGSAISSQYILTAHHCASPPRS